MDFRTLREALRERLTPYGIKIDTPDVERVRFPLDVPKPKREPVLPFGAAAGFVHPAAGYSVGEAFRLAPRIAAAIAAGEDPWPALWPSRARFVHFLRHCGLEALLSLSATETRDFFELFFDLPPDAQRGYLSGRDDPGATFAAMLPNLPQSIRAGPPGLRQIGDCPRPQREQWVTKSPKRELIRQYVTRVRDSRSELRVPAVAQHPHWPCDRP
ncbi:lycopene cyclase family protein [Kibdelosporangium aridum]|uniref:lycopene cyclase family protein n=1 Tax=Kibdelosporangium aridum TaxID=2030 RepID=UPI0035EBD4A0